MQRKYISYLYLFLLVPLFFIACRKNDHYSIPVPKSTLQNDCIKRTLGPNLVGQPIEFAYAMAILPEKGKIVSAQVVASIPGDGATYLENKSYYTNISGVDVGVPIGTPSVNSGATTTVTFNVDTAAATLRYFYIIPEEARGKSVSFTFSAKSSNGETVSYQMGPYTISNMSMKLNLPLKDGDASYISIKNMAVYTAVEAANHANDIDLVYLYRALPTVAFNHALVAPGADVTYLPGVTLPAGVKNSARILKVFDLQDRNLANLRNGIYIDDLDFQQINLTDAPGFAINLKAEAGAWVETADGKYRGYIFINKVDNANKSMTVSIKQYAL